VQTRNKTILIIALSLGAFFSVFGQKRVHQSNAGNFLNIERLYGYTDVHLLHSANEPEELYFEEQFWEDDDASSSNLVEEQPDNVFIIVPKAGLYFSNHIPSSLSLPFYILYCNWKIHLS
jgi:hypothetical protein